MGDSTEVTTGKIDRGWVDLYVAASVFLLLVGYSTSLYAGFWAIRFALVLLLAGVGVPCLGFLWRSARRPAAVAALLFLLAGTASAVFSDDTWASVLGRYNAGTGLLFMAGLVGAWACGCCGGPRCPALVARAFMAGVVVNAAVAVVQVAVASQGTGAWTRALRGAGLQSLEGRSDGTLGNPVYLGALAVGAVALLIAGGRAPTALSALGIALGAAAVQASGARSAVVVLIGILLWRWATGERRMAIVASLAAVAGVAATVALAHVAGHSATGTTSRLVSGSGGLTSRLHHWVVALPAIGHRPFLGAGPGRFGPATTAHVSLSGARVEGGRRYVDAHNLAVEYATTTGLLGVGALAAWLVYAVRSASGPLLVAGLSILAVGLVEPQSVATTPVAFLLLGVAAVPLTGHRAAVPLTGHRAAVPLTALPTVAGPHRPARVARAALVTVSCLIAVFVAGRIVVGDWWLQQAHLDLVPSKAHTALEVEPPWPAPASVLAISYIFQARAHNMPALQRDVIHWDVVAVSRDRWDPELWATLADHELDDGLTADALRHYGEARRLDPWSIHALDGLGVTEEVLRHPAAARQWFLLSLRVVPTQPAISAELAKLP